MVEQIDTHGYQYAHINIAYTVIGIGMTTPHVGRELQFIRNQ